MISFARKHAPSRPVVNLFLFMSIVWAAAVGPFSFVLILKHLGASSSQVGVYTALCAVINMFCQPAWGLLSDKVGSPRRVLCLCLAVSAVIFGFVTFAKSFYFAAALLLAQTIFHGCTIPLLDSHTLSEINVLPGVQYSFIRLGASLLFGGMSLVYSAVINAYDVMAIIPISIGISSLAILWGMLGAKGKWESTAIHTESPKPKPNLLREAVSLLRGKRYIIFICFVSLWALATQPLYTFIIDFVTAVGGGPGDVPMIQAVRCIGEIPAFIVAGTLGQRISAKRLMFAGMVFWVLHMLGIMYASSFFWLCACHMLAGPGFILGLAGRMRYIFEITPEPVRSTSITVMGACEIGLGAIAGNLIAGFVSGAYGPRALAMVSMAALSIPMVMLLFVKTNEEVSL